MALAQGGGSQLPPQWQQQLPPQPFNPKFNMSKASFGGGRPPSGGYNPQAIQSLSKFGNRQRMPYGPMNRMPPMLRGRGPFQGRNPRQTQLPPWAQGYGLGQLQPGVPPWMDQVAQGAPIIGQHLGQQFGQGASNIKNTLLQLMSIIGGRNVVDEGIFGRR